MNKKEQREFKIKLLSDIHDVCHKRKNLINKYKVTSDDDLIESIIYEELALKSRYTYLTRLANAYNIKLDSGCVPVIWES
jgi:hypothetical protein